LRTIHPESLDRRSADIRECDNDAAVNRPIKVIKPLVMLRMKQPALKAIIIEARQSIRFKTIATGASQAKIPKLG
jgi:hypothetical protein